VQWSPVTCIPAVHQVRLESQEQIHCEEAPVRNAKLKPGTDKTGRALRENRACAANEQKEQDGDSAQRAAESMGPAHHTKSLKAWTKLTVDSFAVVGCGKRQR
jgi:hypothetical protein